MREWVKKGKLAATFDMPVDKTRGEKNFDLVEMLNHFPKNTNTQSVAKMKNFLQNKLIVEISTNPLKKPEQKVFGLSLFMPTHDTLFKDYASLPFYQDAGLWQEERKQLATIKPARVTRQR